MPKKRMNITLPKEDAERLKRIANKSAFIAQAVRDKLDAAEAASKEEELAKAYSAAAKEDSLLSDEWDAVNGDGL